MGTSEAKKVLAGFGIATLLAGVALTGCKSGGAWSGTSGAGGTGEQQKQQQSAWGGKTGTGGAGSAWGGHK